MIRNLTVIVFGCLLATAAIAAQDAAPDPQCARSDTAEWQWSVPVTTVSSKENQGHPRAFLWIPPNCRYVRGVVIGQHNMEEEGILEHPVFRANLSKLGLAEIWVSPAFAQDFNFDDPNVIKGFNEMMTELAKKSGYSELAFAPVIPLGHSAMAGYPWNFAAWNPGRTLAVISYSGTWPGKVDPRTQKPYWDKRSVAGVPGLVRIGEYEWAEQNAVPGAQYRAAHPDVPLSMVADPGAGHFDYHDRIIDYLNLFVSKAVQYRLPPGAPEGQPVKLIPIDPQKGWLAERWHKNNGPTANTAPYAEYFGKKDEAFWFFDEETARATEKYEAEYRGKSTQLLGYIQNNDGKIVSQNPKAHQQVTLKFKPLEDGISFRVKGTFLDTVPEGRPERWTGKRKGNFINHSEDENNISIDRICGPVIKTGPDTFAIRMHRLGDNPRRMREIWLMATHPGNAAYRRSVQQSALYIPPKNTSGKDQTITFPAIPDQVEGVNTVRLKAVSDSGLPVYFYVQDGPAMLNGKQLEITAIPPRSKFPVQVTVVAWQWGRSVEPRIKSATPVAMTFNINKR